MPVTYSKFKIQPGRGGGGQIVPVTLLLAPVFVDLPTALGGMVLGDLHFTIDE